MNSLSDSVSAVVLILMLIDLSSHIQNQRPLGGEDLVGPDVARNGQLPGCEIGRVQVDLIAVSLGLAGDLAKHDIRATPITDNQCRSALASAQV